MWDFEKSLIWHCVVAVCQCSLKLAGLSGAVLSSQTLLMSCKWGWVSLRLCDLWHYVRPWPVRSLQTWVSQLMRLRSLVEMSGWRSVCESLVIVVLLHPCMKWHCVCVGGGGLLWSGIVCILVLSRQCCISGIVCGHLVGFQWPVKISRRKGVLEEQDGGVVGMSAPSPLA